MIKKEYIVGTQCPSCNHVFEESEVSGDNVQCSFCGFTTTLRTPLQRKREKAVLKNHVKMIKLGNYFILGQLLFWILPLYLYLLFTDQTWADIWSEHPIGVVIYSVITLVIILNLGVFFLFLFMHIIRKHDYDIDWIRAFYRKHPKFERISKLSTWENPIEKMDEL